MAHWELPFRSGVVNTIIWLVLEVGVMYAFDRLLCFISNQATVLRLLLGKRVTIRQSRVPIFGSGIIGNDALAFMLAFARFLLVVALLVMNLGIDGAEAPHYKPVVLTSGVQPGDGCVQRVQKRTNSLHKCLEYSANRDRFTVYAPVFNLTRRNVSKTKKHTVVDDTLYCLDDVQAKPKYELITGRILPASELRTLLGFTKKVVLQPLNGTRSEFGGGHEYEPGEIVPLGRIQTVPDRTSILTANVSMQGYCTPRSRVKLHDRPKGAPRKFAQSVRCFAVVRDNVHVIFLRFHVLKLYQSKVDNVTTASLRITNGVQISTRYLDWDTTRVRAFAENMLNDAPFDYLLHILQCNFVAMLRTQPRIYLVRDGTKSTTKIRLLSVFIAIAVAASAIGLFIFAVCWSFATRPVRRAARFDLELNSIDGLSHILVRCQYGQRNTGARAVSPQCALADLEYKGGLNVLPNTRWATDRALDEITAANEFR